MYGKRFFHSINGVKYATSKFIAPKHEYGLIILVIRSFEESANLLFFFKMNFTYSIVDI